MTTYYTDRRDSWVIALEGNIVSGETYKAKDYIKAALGGRWNAERKVWIVDLAKVESATKSATGLYEASEAQIAKLQPAPIRTVTADEALYNEIEALERRMDDPNSDL